MLYLLQLILVAIEPEVAKLTASNDFYTTENLITVLIGVITLTSGAVIWFVNKAIAAQEKREEKTDALLIEVRKDITVLQKDSSIHTYTYATVDRRVEKLEAWKEEMQKVNK